MRLSIELEGEGGMVFWGNFCSVAGMGRTKNGGYKKHVTFKRMFLSLMFVETYNHLKNLILVSINKCLKFNLIRFLFRCWVLGYKCCASYRVRISIVKFQIP